MVYGVGDGYVKIVYVVGWGVCLGLVLVCDGY